MRKTHAGALALGTLVTMIAWSERAIGQASPGGSAYPQSGPSSNMPSTPEQSDQQRFFRENVYGKRNSALKATAAQKVTATQEAGEILASSSLACKLVDAAQVAEGPATVNGHAVNTKTYEIACDSGVGYFLIAQPPEKPVGFSCFAADAARAAAQGKPTATVCMLSANADLKTMISAALSRQGKTCQARDVRWIGQNSKAGVEFIEAACADGAGYVLKLPQPQSSQQAAALACADAARQGIACKLTDSGTPIVTIETFKAALAQHKIACDAVNVRVIGKQSMSKRHVVEFQCPQQPQGLVAFIPLSDSTAPFETMDCPTAAAKQHVACKAGQ